MRSCLLDAMHALLGDEQQDASTRQRALRPLKQAGSTVGKSPRRPYGRGALRIVATYTLMQPDKDRCLGEQLIATTQEVPRFGYRRMSAWLALGESRVQRMWRALQLNIPRRRPRRRRCGNDIRLRGATQPNSGWSYDFVHDQLVGGRVLEMRCVIDEYTRKCLALEVGASLRSQDVILTLSRLMNCTASRRLCGRTTAPNLPLPRSCAGRERLQSVSLHRARKSVAKRIRRKLQRRCIRPTNERFYSNPQASTPTSTLNRFNWKKSLKLNTL